MDNNIITVKVLINGVLFKLVLINTDYECCFIVDKNLIIELRLPCIKIPLKSISGFIKKNTKESWVVTRNGLSCQVT